jgi:ribA/ribD-fused uncharacterized protein
MEFRTAVNSENKNEDLILFFSGKSYLSNFYKCRFTFEGVVFSSNEQFFHFKKAELFNDKDAMKKILATDYPADQKKIGRTVKNYNESVWSKHCYSIMKQGLYAKFSQNDNLKKKMLSNPKARFVEASLFDKKWGIGINSSHPNATFPSKWKGSNLLGKALDEVRDSLKPKLDSKAT